MSLESPQEEFKRIATRFELVDITNYVAEKLTQREKITKDRIDKLKENIDRLLKENVHIEKERVSLREGYDKLEKRYEIECGRNSEHIMKISQLSDKCRTYEFVITELRSRSLWDRILNKPVNISTASKGERQLVEELQNPREKSFQAIDKSMEEEAQKEKERNKALDQFFG